MEYKYNYIGFIKEHRMTEIICKFITNHESH
jgi:hypothetical protein